jgi:diguanylate cyclase (GGDEF)-like protein
MTPVAPEPDFATRIWHRLDEMHAGFTDRRLLDTVRDAHASLNPKEVATWIVAEASRWVAAPCWAVIAGGADGDHTLLAGEGVDIGAEGSLQAAASWVLRNGQVMFSSNQATDDRVSGGMVGTVLVIPLSSRGRTVAALVGFDPVSSTGAAALEPSLTSMRYRLEPTAIALDNALIIGRAEALSVTDELTRLFNLRFLNMVLRRETKRALRGSRPLSLLFIDLDGFKTVNDRFGHQAGSQALVETAAVIRGCARETDVVARYGGDEFSVVLPDTDSDGALAAARRVQRCLRDRVFLETRGHALRLTASVGVATLPEVTGSAEELLRAADMAMYKVKAGGKDGIHVTEER